MTDTFRNFRALCAELAKALDHDRQCLMDDRSLTHPLADRTRAALAVEAVERLPDGAQIIEPTERTVLVPVPRPIPVAERLPGPEDCNAEGEVWVIEAGYSYAIADTGDYDWEPHRIVMRSVGQFDAKHGRSWLPAHAIPIPQENADG